MKKTPCDETSNVFFSTCVLGVCSISIISEIRRLVSRWVSLPWNQPDARMGYFGLNGPKSCFPNDWDVIWPRWVSLFWNHCGCFHHFLTLLTERVDNEDG